MEEQGGMVEGGKLRVNVYFYLIILTWEVLKNEIKIIPGINLGVVLGM